MSDANWVYGRYGQDMTRANPGAVQNVAGNRVFVPSLNKMPFGEQGLGIIQTVTGASATIDKDTELVVIDRNAPVATTLNIFDLMLADSLLGILDWSSNITEHTITLVPAGGQTIMKFATFPIVSTGNGGATTFSRASVILTPIKSLLTWMV